MRVVLTGPTGLLGSSFLKALGTDAVGLSRNTISASNAQTIAKIISESEPDVLINCAAHVNADMAEDDPQPAYEANVELPKNLASACRQIGIPIVHFSSTGCYGAWKETPYTESDPTHPTTVHHLTKTLGEEAVRRITDDHLILRTGWLFGGEHYHGKNFVWKRLLEASQSNTMTSDRIQRGCPTWVDDVVAQTILLIQKEVRGTLNCVNQGVASRFEYVSAIVEQFKLPCRVVPGEAFIRRAPVSFNESAINQQMQQLELNRMPDWVASLALYSEQIMKWPEWQRLIEDRGPRS